VATLETFLQLLIAGVLSGCLYGLMCAGLALIFGVMRVINFAQGDFMMLAMYFALAFTSMLVGSSQDHAFVFALIGSLFAGALFYGIGVGVHKMLIGRVTGTRMSNQEDGGHTPQLLLTLGISLVLQNAALMFFGSSPRTIRNPLSGRSWELPVWGEDVVIFLNQARTYVAAISLILVIGLALLMSRTRLGRRLRASADNPVAATYMGVDVNKAHRNAFGIGIALTAVAGAMMTTFYPFQPFTGQEFVIIMYAGVVLGGMGSVGGAFIGGLIIGLVEQLSTLLMPLQLQTTAIFGVFLLILIARPQGLFGRQVERA
jgi:branched-chain amino acid transport system permease protein